MYQKAPVAPHSTQEPVTEEIAVKGNNRLLLNILQSNIYCLIKVEGKRMQYGDFQPYHHVISTKKGQLDYFLSYPSKELDEYHNTQTTMILRLDNIDSEFVIREFLKSTPAS